MIHLEDRIEKINTLQNLFNSIKKNNVDKAQDYITRSI